MYTKADLRTMLEQMDISHDATLMVHCDVEAVGDIDGGADALLDVLCEHLSDGLLVLPTHTWATVNAGHNVFDPANEPSCSGLLGELLRKRPYGVRSLHPTHSVTAFGRDAAAFVAEEHLRATPCPREGCVGRLLDRRGRLLLIGCTLRDCTFMHGVEEWNEIDHRLSEPSPCFIIMDDGSMFLGQMCEYASPVGDVSPNYDKMLAPLLELHAMREGHLGDARTLLCDCDDLVRFTSEFLICCPDLFLDAEPVERRYVDELLRLEEP